VTESGCVDARHRIGDGHTREATAAIKSIVGYFRHIIPNSQTGERSAIVKYRFTDTSHSSAI